jgi:hypothetical protein
MDMRTQLHVLSIDREHGIVFLEDLGGPFMSITNNAQSVLRYVQSHYGSKFRTVYRDTENEWWEITPRHYPGWVDVEFEPWDGLAWDLLKRQHHT